MNGWRLGAALLLLIGGCNPNAPVIDYTGLTCSESDGCGNGWSCVKSICMPAGSAGATSGGSGTSTTRSASSSRGSSSTGNTSLGSTSSVGSTSSGSSSSGGTSSGGSSSGGSSSSSGSSSGGATSSGGSSSGGTTGPPIQVGPQVLASGYEYTCTIEADGGVLCWGNNLWGNLGNGTLNSQIEPGPILGLPGPAAFIAANNAHTCAITTVGELYCCGGNGNGELGNGTQTLTQLSPVQVLGLSGVTGVATGVAHTCAVAGGAAMCMGNNQYGQLGNNNTNSSSIPVQVTGLLTGVTAITSGDFHTCAINSAGQVYCWGSNSNGQLGNGNNNAQKTPVLAKGLPYVVSLAAGQWHTCALTGAGAVYCWGSNTQGQLGTPFVTGNQLTAVPVPSLTSGVAGIAAELHNTCAVTAAGDVYCWGDNTYGQLGSGTDAGQSNVPLLVAGLPPGMIAVTIAQYSGCAEAADGGVFCWGFGGYGELGNGGAYDSLAPVTVALDDDGGVDAGPLSPSSGGIAISEGMDQVLLLTASGAVEAWGNGVWGQLGEGVLASSLIPEPISSLGSAMTAISAGELHSCALDSSGNVWGWGANQYGDLGDGTNTISFVPVAVVGLPAQATAIACGGDHGCAVVSGGVYCWGNNTNGELGNGQVSSSSSPVQVVNLSPVTVAGVATTQGFSCAWSSAGAAYCWGDDADGLLGDGNTQQETVPTPVTGLGSGTTQISVARVLNNSEGVGHACAVASGAAYCWGSNQYGELGDGAGGNAVFSTTPVPVVGLDGGVTQVAVGSNHSCALTTGGAVLCWGRGDFGALGNGSNNSVDTPVLVLDGGALAITAGEQSSCALTNNAAFCWGYGGDGELGNGSLVNSNVPVPVQ